MRDVDAAEVVVDGNLVGGISVMLAVILPAADGTMPDVGAEAAVVSGTLGK